MPGLGKARAVAQLLGAGVVAGTVSFASGLALLPLGTWGGAAVLAVVFLAALVLGCATFVLLCGLRSGALGGLCYGLAALVVVVLATGSSPSGSGRGIAPGSGSTLLLLSLTMAAPLVTGTGVGAMRRWLARSAWESFSLPSPEFAPTARVTPTTRTRPERIREFPGIPGFAPSPQLSGAAGGSLYLTGQDPRDFE